MIIEKIIRNKPPIQIDQNKNSSKKKEIIPKMTIRISLPSLDINARSVTFIIHPDLFCLTF